MVVRVVPIVREIKALNKTPRKKLLLWVQRSRLQRCRWNVGRRRRAPNVYREHGDDR